jgi:hypothetical protein
MPLDLIVIDDASTEDQRQTLFDFLSGCREHPKIRDLVIIRNDAPIYETASENLGYAIARTEFVISMQVDIFVETPGFDSLLISALKLPSKPIAASGRCGHPLRWVFNPNRHPKDHAFGLFDTKIDWSEDSGLGLLLERGLPIEVETVNRAPLAFRLEDLRALGFFDERHFFLGNDDHEFMLRARLSLGRFPVYVPMKVRSKISDGASRRPREGVNKEIYDLLAGRPKSPFFEIVGRSISNNALETNICIKNVI